MAGPAVTIRDRRLILLTAVSTNLLGQIGLSGLNIGLPAMEVELALSAAQMGWISLAMFLTMAATAAPGAKLADILGRRRTSLAGYGACLAGLLWGALAGGAFSVIAGRSLTGLGLAVVLTNNTAMATSVYPPERRGRVLGYTTGAVYLGLSLGPLICGYLVVWWGWRAIFWFNIISFLPPLALTALVKLEQRPARGEKLDLKSAALWAASVLAICGGLVNITSWPLGPGLTLLGSMLIYSYIRVSLASPTPVLDLRLFTESRRFAFSSLAAFISYAASTGIGFVLALYLQYTRGLPVEQAGLLLMVQPACQALLTPLAGRLSDRFDPGLMASAGMALLSLALGLMAALLSPAMSWPLFVALLIMLGVGFATFGAPNSNAIIGSAPPHRVGQASGTITATRLCGQVFSIALTTLIFSLTIGPGLITPDKYPAFMRAATLCFTLFTPICLAGVLASLARGRMAGKSLD